jgi:hypothetical protein
VKLAIGLGKGGGISGISGSGGAFRTMGAFGAGFRAAFARATGRRALAALALLLLFAALPDLPPDFPEERAFAMTAYATGGSRRRQPRRSALNCVLGEITLRRDSDARPILHHD